jgi:hypothetical protein
LVIDPATGGPRTFTRNDGSVGANLEVTAVTVRFLSSRSDAQEGYDSGFDSSNSVGEPDEIPF